MFHPSSESIAPDVKMSLLIDMLEESTRIWRAELGHVSDSAVTWQPFFQSHSIGGLLLHMADVEAHWIQTLVAKMPRPREELETLQSLDTNPEQGVWPTPLQWPLAEYYKLQNATRRRSIAILKGLGNPDMQVHSPKGTVTLGWIVNYLISHEAYHAGQLMLHKLHHGWNGREPSPHVGASQTI